MKFVSLAAVLAVSGLVVAGCGSGGGGASTSPSSKAAMRDAAVKYSQCMRENGVKNFPDPQPDGGLLIKAGPGTGIDPQSPAFKAAQEACKKYQPKQSGTFNKANAQKMEQQALDFARCMRAHGVNFPDPQFEDGGRGVKFGGPGINPNDPKFKAASQACAKNLPGAGSGPGGGLALGGGK
jgi:hypothetical protein